jgi:uncharacterized protein YbjT (DUF2867 family)
MIDSLKERVEVMKILVVGANGQIGKQLVAQIQERNDLQARAMIRNEEAAYFKDIGAEIALADLEDDVDSIAKAAKGADAIVFTAGSGPHTGKDKTIMIDLDGAVKTVEAAKEAGVKRFVMVSSFDTTRKAIQDASSSFAPYVIAKHYADVWLRDAGLNYTIVHPGMLTDDAGTGKVEAATKVERGEVPREDIAKVIVSVLGNDQTIGKEFQVVGGTQPVDEAIGAL